MPYDNFPATNKKLGITYNKSETIFRIWSPARDKIQLLIYPDANSMVRNVYPMEKYKDGVHEAIIKGDLKGHFYNFLIEDIWEVTDPYAISSSMNSIRSAIIDLMDTNPKGWEEHTVSNENDNYNPIIYEVHIKDFTGHITSGAINKGKYLGFVEKDTDYNGFDTGLNHLRDLGVTHVHLMPVFDFLTVDEDKEYFYEDKNYNWGYDPELYNVPEGSYSTEPNNPISRIKELKTLIMELHNSGFKVILDVVYNHTYRAYDSNFNQIIPGYYYRLRSDGTFSDGSGCGNELATERPMVRKFIIDSLLYWLKEYKIDGFRFDLMALIDIETIEEAIRSLRRINPNVLIYGEPWTGGITILPDALKTTKGRQAKLSFGFFNDDFRNALKGDNDGNSRGFVQGNLNYKLATETGIAGSIYYDNGHIGFTAKPSESINYVNSHDNLILVDKIIKTFPEIDDGGIERLNKFAFSILLTSQGIPFIHGGNEFLQGKSMIHNSYNAPLSINAIDWSLKEKNIGFYNYFKDLIHLRKEYDAFRLKDTEEVRDRLKFMDYPSTCSIIAYTIILDKKDEKLLIIHNANPNICFISKLAIKEHIKKKYGRIYKDIELVPILDLDGLVKEKEAISDFGIEVPHFGTLIYKIKAIY